MAKLTVGLFFGGRSTEHEVSVVSALQAYENLDKEKYHVVPVYVSKAGEFFTNPKFLHIKNYTDITSLLFSSKQVTFGRKNSRGGLMVSGLFGKFIPLDIAFPIFHGSFGEDGCIQGVFETFQIPYVGFNVLGSAIAMDKFVAKQLFQALGIPTAPFNAVIRHYWNADRSLCLKHIKNSLKFPLFVKPGTAGSSIGVGRAKNEDELQFAIEVAFTYSESVIIEEAFPEGVIEVNCSVLGYEHLEASVCEQPIPSKDVLSFTDKYMRGGGKGGSKGAGGMETLSRIIPAPISKELTKKIQDATKMVFSELNGCGVARVDYFVDPKKDKFWINEINTPPGSLAYYLWEKSGVSYPELLDKLIEFGLKRAKNQSKTQYTFESGLLAQMASGKAVSGK
jgi:D-alanine-D-alanine ligase